MARKDLAQAKDAKKDEFYTQMDDITAELKHYKDHFRGKVVFCNCDDSYESNFFKYFALKFNAFGLKKLITTCYDGSPISGNEIQFDKFEEEKSKEEKSKKVAYKIELTEVTDTNGDGAIDLVDIKYILKNKKNTLSMLKGDAKYGKGDFRSEECIKLLEQADIVVTNPPFSLFREFLALLEQYNKQFIVIGNTNALTYKEVFRMFQSDRIRTGYTNFNVGMFFQVPKNYEKYHHLDKDGNKFARVSTSCWFTNLPVQRHNEDLILYKHYTSEEYPKYDNYDAINVNTYTDIPCDYDGVIGVPITFLDKYNPDQFEIIKFRKGDDDKDLVINGKSPYFRILIRKKKS